MSDDRDMSICLTFGELSIEITAEGVSWSPDVMLDMSHRTLALYKDAMTFTFPDEYGEPKPDEATTETA